MQRLTIEVEGMHKFDAVPCDDELLGLAGRVFDRMDDLPDDGALLVEQLTGEQDLWERLSLCFLASVLTDLWRFEILAKRRPQEYAVVLGAWLEASYVSKVIDARAEIGAA